MQVLVNGQRLFDHMMVSSYLRCWNHYFFKYVLGLSAPDFQEPLIAGIIFHDCLAKWYTTKSISEVTTQFERSCQEHDYENNSLNALKASHPRCMANMLKKIKSYCEFYKHSMFDVIDTEVEHFVPLVALKRYGVFSGNSKIKSNGDASIVKGHNVYYVGHIDCVGKSLGNYAYLEHKTTTLYNGSPLLEAYTFGMQVKGYTMCLMDKYGLSEPCNGYIDLVFLKTSKDDSGLLRYPLSFDIMQINAFKDRLSYVIGDILWRERILKEWSLPDPCKCTAFNRVCEYQNACDLLPNIKASQRCLMTAGFIDTKHSRVETIEEESVGSKNNNKMYYSLQKGLSL